VLFAGAIAEKRLVGELNDVSAFSDYDAAFNLAALQSADYEDTIGEGYGEARDRRGHRALRSMRWDPGEREFERFGLPRRGKMI
jgi:hypothetical protein